MEGSDSASIASAELLFIQRMMCDGYGFHASLSPQLKGSEETTRFKRFSLDGRRSPNPGEDVKRTNGKLSEQKHLFCSPHPSSVAVAVKKTVPKQIAGASSLQTLKHMFDPVKENPSRLFYFELNE